MYGLRFSPRIAFPASAFALAVSLLGLLISTTAALALPAGVEVEVDREGRRIRLTIPEDQVVIQDTKDGTSIVSLLGGSDGSLAPGAPDLPVIALPLWVDESFHATRVAVTHRETAVIGRHRPAAVAEPQKERSEDEVLGVEEIRRPDPAIYGASSLYPAEIARLGGEGWMRGRRLVQVRVTPCQVNPVTGEVVLTRAMTLEITGETDAARGLQPRPVYWERKVDHGLGKVVLDLRSASGRGGPPIPTEPEQFWSPTFRPSLDGSPVEYVIVTNAAMASQFEALAQWKAKRGVQAVVRTIEWIGQTYPNGIDRAEQLRTFLRDAYENWGTLYVLLGGDTDVLPVRYATHSLNNPPDQIPADLYFSSLERNWNQDGDSVIGEGRPPGQPAGGDSTDLYPELYIGRAPVTSPSSATIFVNKIKSYEEGNGTTGLYPNSALLLCERISPSEDGASYGEQVRQRLPAGMRVVRLYQENQNYPGSLPLTRARAIDSLRAGFGIVHHIGHGFRNTMHVADGSLSNADIDQLTNGARQPVVFAINCSGAAIDFNSIGERFLRNANGGGVAYIGSSRILTAGGVVPYQNEFYELVFTDSVTSIGEAFALSKVPFIGDAESETPQRFTQFALVLIGDPETPIWRRAPEEISVTPANYVLGSGIYSVTATVDGQPLAGATVSLLKGTEAYALDTTNSSGVAEIPWRPETTGPFTVTVSKPGYRPIERTAQVTSTAQPYLFVNLTTVNDDSVPPSMGNGDGLTDAGERVEVAVRVRNGGGQTATGITGSLTVITGGTHTTIVQNTVSYGSIAPGGQSTGASTFVIDFDPDAPDAYQPVFQIVLTTGQGVFPDTFVLPVRGIELEHYSHVLTDPQGDGDGLPEPGETIIYRVTLRNNGTGRASSVANTLRVLNRNTMQPDPSVTILDGTASYGTLLPGQIVQGDQMSFALAGNAVVSNLLVELSFTDSQGPRGEQLSDLNSPTPITGLHAEGSVNSIRLTWTPPVGVADIRGYDIFRSPTFPPGQFVRVNNHTAVGSAIFEDVNLNPLTRYYYYVVARDSSSNASIQSAVMAANTTPPLAAGWPIEMGQGTSAGVVIDDLDRDGDFEIVTGADALYAWHHDGIEIRDGDNQPLTSGVFSTDGQDPEFGFHATPAIADLTGDGDMEIIGVSWREAECYVWNLNGTLEPGWPQPLDGDFNWSSPVVEDLDGDGDMEIIAASGLGGRIYAWHHNGLEVTDGDNNPFTFGVFFISGSGFLYSSPAVGNIDADPNPEIVFGTQTALGKVFALNHDATVVPGWPVSTIGQVTASPAMADLDNDGRNEVIIAAESDSVFVLKGDGSDFPGWPRPAVVDTDQGHTGSPVVADLDNNGSLDIIFAANNGQMHAWRSNGTTLTGWGAVFFAEDALGADATQSTPTIANADADTNLEVFVGAENRSIYGWNHDGSVLAGFPIAIGGEQRSAITIWDVDADGLAELAATSNDRNMYVWDLNAEFIGNRNPWPFFRHDVRNTGRFTAPLTSVGVADPGPFGAPSAGMKPVLYPAHPNPFNPSTTIRFLVPGEAGATRPVRLRIFDVAGRLVRELIDGPFDTGEGAVPWDGRSSRGGRAPSGAYFMELEVGGDILTGKLTLLQ